MTFGNKQDSRAWILLLGAIFFILFTVRDSLGQGACRALDFDGIDDYINVGEIDSDSWTAITIEAWIYHDALSSDERIVCKARGLAIGNHIFSLAVADDYYQVKIGTDGAGGGNTSHDSNSGVHQATTWEHVAFTWDSVDATLRFYVDGQPQGTVAKNGDSFEDDNQDVCIGNVNTVNSRHFDGVIDEVRIWNVARTEEQIQQGMCQTLDPDSEPDLVCYWKLDEESVSGQVKDSKGNRHGSYSGNMTNDDCVWSGAALGDASNFDYTGSNPEDFTASIYHTDGDYATVTGDGGSMTGLQVYRVDTTSMRPEAIKPNVSWQLDPERYWGVFATGSAPTYTITYHYDGHPGIFIEDDLDLASRDNNNDDTWADLNATLDTGANTLTKSGQTGTEYALGSQTGDNALPVTLSSFTGDATAGMVILSWRTECEVDNAGFYIYRSVDDTSHFEKLNEQIIPGAGTTTIPQDYEFIDGNVTGGHWYYYNLEAVSMNGQTSGSSILGVYVADPTSNEPCDEYRLSLIYPNPFNSSTTISYTLAETVKVKLSVYDIRGNIIEILVNDWCEACRHAIAFTPQRLASGVYICRLTADRYTASAKMALLK